MTRDRDLATRDRILVEASRLFARRGYYGSTTRDIAEATGIRQPSLFHHFSSKSAILMTLVDIDLTASLAEIRGARAAGGALPQQLHRYLARDTAAFLALPFDARGFYTDAVFQDPEFADQRARIDELHGLTRALVAEGVAAGDYVPIDAEFAERAITALLIGSMRERGAYPTVASERPLQVADLVLRGLLAEPVRVLTLHEVTAQEMQLLPSPR
jgi:AcrR family transcriptional regulator